MSPAAPKVNYDCSKCPGYCCSYPRIEVQDADVKRLARHFGLELAVAQRRFTRIYKDDEGSERILKHQKDAVYGSICRFFDTTERRCTVYTARPAVCRQYPNGSRCGYYEFIRFERKHQDNPDFIPLDRS
jgi:Fe-S-cluster containining protein